MPKKKKSQNEQPRPKTKTEDFLEKTIAILNDIEIELTALSKKYIVNEKADLEAMQEIREKHSAIRSRISEMTEELAGVEDEDRRKTLGRSIALAELSAAKLDLDHISRNLNITLGLQNLKDSIEQHLRNYHDKLLGMKSGAGFVAGQFLYEKKAKLKQILEMEAKLNA